MNIWEDALEELYNRAECDYIGSYQYELGRILFAKEDGIARQEGADWIKTAADNGYKEAKEFMETIYFEPYL